MLVVEDDADAQMLLTVLLGRRGHDVRGVRSGEEGLALLRESAFDAVLTDENLRGTPGSTMLRAAFAEGLLTAEHAMICTADPFARPPPGVRLMTKPLDVAAVTRFVENRPRTRRRDEVELVLYVCGKAPASVRAIRNVRAIVARSNSTARLHIHDLARDPAAAERVGIVRTPVLVRTRPAPHLKLVGDLRDAEPVEGLLAPHS